MAEIAKKPPMAEIRRVRDWAQQKIQAGSEPPWAWYQYMKLTEAVDAILQGMNATTTANLPQSAGREGKRLQLVEAKSRQDTAQLHHVEPKVRMPM